MDVTVKNTWYYVYSFVFVSLIIALLNPDCYVAHLHVLNTKYIQLYNIESRCITLSIINIPSIDSM